MSLQVWLPLNGDLENRGLSEYAFSNSATSFITVDNSGKIGKCYNFNSTSSNNGIYSADDGFMSKYINNKSWTIGLWAKTDSTDTCPISLSYGLRMFIGNSTHISLYNSSNTVNCNSSVSGNDNKWHHFCVTYDTVTNNIKFYVDGVNTGNASYSSGTYASSWTNGIYIGRDPNNSTVNDHYLYRGKLNDVRIYDHCLSDKEVKETAKGLVLHYKLDNSTTSANLLKDTTNFSLSGSDYGATSTRTLGKVTVISNSAFNAYQWVQSYFGPDSTSIVNNTKTYTLSVDILANGVSTTAKPIFSIDFRRDDHSQLVKGTVYLDPNYNGVWHRYSIPITGSGQNQTRCLINTSGTNCNGVTIEYKNFKFEEGNNPNGLWTPYYNGGPVVDSTILDSSGYGYNGTINGALTINNDSAKYSKCTVFDGNTASITLGNLSTICPEGNFTFNCWIYKDGTWSTKSWETILGGPSGFELETKYSGINSPVIVNYSWGKTSMPYNLNEWTMITMTRNSSETKYYINGSLAGTGTAGTIPSGNYFIGAWSSSSGQNYKGKVSDVRIYNTVLSESDIKELYETSASIDKNGNLYCRELVEV